MVDKSRTAARDSAQFSREYEGPDEVIIWDLHETDRAKMLCARSSFYHGCQHNHLTMTWSGQSRDPGVGYLLERLEPQGFVSTNAAVSGQWGKRRPDCPTGLHKQIVSRFSDMLMGEQGKPMLRVPSDPATEAYLAAIMKESRSWSSLITARDYKGARGSSAVVVSVIDGQPQSEALKTEHLWIPTWKDAADWIPEEVFEQRRVTKEVARAEDDEEGAAIQTKVFWRTRYWNTEVEVKYHDVPEDWNEEDPDRPIPVEAVTEHKAGRCPVVWLQNTRNTHSPEGEEDYIGVYQESDRLDRLRSFVVRASIANTDPTLVQKDNDRMLRRTQSLKKGHGALIQTSETGDAKFLESSGAGIERAWQTATEVRHDILQTTQCVVMDPETMTSYKSGEALQMLWLAMESKCDRLRMPLEDEVRQVSELWIALGVSHGVSSVEDAAQSGIILPPREMDDDDADDDAEVKLETHKVGKGKYVDVVWGHYHRPTALQFQALATALTTANGMRPVLSQKTATTIMAGAVKVSSVEEEFKQMKKEQDSEAEQFAVGEGSQFGDLDMPGTEEVAKLKSEASTAEVKAEPKPEKPPAGGNSEA